MDEYTGNCSICSQSGPLIRRPSYKGHKALLHFIDIEFSITTCNGNLLKGYCRRCFDYQDLKGKPDVGGHARQSKEATSFASAWGGQAVRYITGGVTPVHTSKGGNQVPQP